MYKDSYFKEGVDDYNSYNVRSNLDAQVSKNLKVSIDINGRRDDVRRAVGSQTNYNWDIGEYIEYGFFDYILAIRPTSPIFYENGLPASIFDDNVVETIRGKRGIKNDLTTNLNTQGTVRWDLPFITKEYLSKVLQHMILLTLEPKNSRRATIYTNTIIQLASTAI